MVSSGMARLVLAIGLGAVAAHAAAMGIRVVHSPAKGFTVGEMSWTGPIEKHGENMTFYGTAEQVLDQIYELNPDFVALVDTDHVGTSRKRTSRQGLLGSCAPGTVEYGEDGEDGEVVEEVEYTKSRILRQVEKNLRKLGSQPCNAGPGECALISCTIAGVWLCNERDYDWGPACIDVAVFIDSIIDTCAKEDQPFGSVVRGSLWEIGSHKVVAGSSPDCYTSL